MECTFGLNWLYVMVSVSFSLFSLFIRSFCEHFNAYKTMSFSFAYSPIQLEQSQQILSVLALLDAQIWQHRVRVSTMVQADQGCSLHFVVIVNGDCDDLRSSQEWGDVLGNASQAECCMLISQACDIESLASQREIILIFREGYPQHWGDQIMFLPWCP